MPKPIKMPEESTPMRLRGDPDDARFWMAGMYRAMRSNPAVWTKERQDQLKKELDECEPGPEPAIDVISRYFHVDPDA